MKTFFEAGRPSTPSLSIRQRETTAGKVKSDLLIILARKTHQKYPGTFDVKVLDGSGGALPIHYQHYHIQRIYASDVCVANIMTHLDTAESANVVWDTYITSRIKESVREKKRCKGIQRKVADQNKLPGICQISRMTRMNCLPYSPRRLHPLPDQMASRSSVHLKPEWSV